MPPFYYRWNWVQVAGELAVREIEQKLEALSKGNLPEYSLEGFEKTLMAIGADGVMVPFRPNGGSPEGKTAWSQEGRHCGLVTKKSNCK